MAEGVGLKTPGYTGNTLSERHIPCTTDRDQQTRATMQAIISPSVLAVSTVVHKSLVAHVLMFLFVVTNLPV